MRISSPSFWTIAIILAATSTHAARQPRLVFSQLDMNLDGQTVENSPWGALDLQYTGAAGVLYVNLSVGGVWQIRNLPVLSREGEGVRQWNRCYFDLQVQPGTDVRAIEQSFSLTPQVLVQPPQTFQRTHVRSSDYIVFVGILGGSILYSPPGGPLVGGLTAGDKVGHLGFPNQEADSSACVPVALSNSVQWLIAHHGLDIPDSEATRERMAEIAGLTSRGCGDGFPAAKDAALGPQGISTTTRPRFEIENLQDEMEMGCDVEILSQDHCVAVTGFQALANGDIVLEVTHDSMQGEDGGLVTETVIYDKVAGKFSGIPVFEGESPDMIVVECVTP